MNSVAMLNEFPLAGAILIVLSDIIHRAGLWPSTENHDTIGLELVAMLNLLLYVWRNLVSHVVTSVKHFHKTDSNVP